MTLPPCPESPNCVCSEGPNASIQPIVLNDPASPDSPAWRAIVRAVEQLPGATRITHAWPKVNAVCQTRLLRFKDDLALRLEDDQRTLHVRSASRVGHSDFGVNRRRVERLRQLLTAAGVTEARNPD